MDKTKIDELKKELLIQPQHAMRKMDTAEVNMADTFCEEYKNFLNSAKTEREAVSYFKKAAIEKGFTEYDKTKKYEAGAKVFQVNRDKALILAVIGKKPMDCGLRISAAHIDSPRIDLKPNPLYEKDELALFKTHYYGGIKKYQWTAIPLSLHGVIVKKDGSKAEVCIGDKEDEPKLVISDLLPHLAREQMKRSLAEGIKGEELNIIIGSRPISGDEGGELVKLNIMKILNEKYGITESDFISADLEAVPAFSASDVGFDKSMIGAYGHDDRVCAYPAAFAAFNCGTPEYTAVTVLADKEEVGSDGNTGLASSYFKYFVYDLAKMQGFEGRDVLRASKCLSADVNSAFDPTFPEVLEARNSAFLNRGVVVTKYTGARGKSDTSDAGAEYMGYIRSLFDANGIIWQTGQLGKVDEGGGGTVAKLIANLDVDVVDVGVPVLSMHAPFELVSKIDVYMAYRAFLTFFKN